MIVHTTLCLLHVMKIDKIDQAFSNFNETFKYIIDMRNNFSFFGLTLTHSTKKKYEYTLHNFAIHTITLE
jgi:hypothetical protein